MILFFSFAFFFSLLIPEAAKSGDFRAAERRDASERVQVLIRLFR